MARRCVSKNAKSGPIELALAMQRTDDMEPRGWRFLGALALAAAVPGCDSGFDGPPWLEVEPCDRVGHPDYTGPGRGAIGPQGGVVEQTTAGDPLLGVRVEVAPGAWDDCWEVVIDYASIFSTPDYPDGYVPFERPGPSGAVDVRIGRSTLHGFIRAPAVPFTVSFPLAGVPAQPGEVHSAFVYDEDAETWRIKLSNDLRGDRLRVETNRHEWLWSWGRTDLMEVDFAAHLEPAMKELYGTDAYEALQDELERIAREGLVQQNLRTCAGLEIAQNAFRGFQSAAERLVDQLMAGMGCGACDPVSTEFGEQVVEYVRLKVKAFIAGMLVDIVPDKLVFLPLKIAFFSMQVAYESMADHLPCNFECFVRNLNPSLLLGIGAYWASAGAVELIELYQIQLGCPGTAVIVQPG